MIIHDITRLIVLLAVTEICRMYLCAFLKCITKEHLLYADALFDVRYRMKYSNTLIGMIILCIFLHSICNGILHFLHL